MWKTPLVNKHFSQDSCIASGSGASTVEEEAGDEFEIFFFLLDLFAGSCGVSSSLSLFVRVRKGPGRPGKCWNFIMALQGHWSWKVLEIC